MLGPGVETRSAKKRRLAKLATETNKRNWSQRISIGKQAERWAAFRHQGKFLSDEAFAEAVLDR
jgi:hypothetical protein